MARKTDRRVQRTQQLLRGALFSLIQEKGFEVLSVQDIIDRANVGRATFYAHFDNKDDLLLSGFDALRATLRERQQEALSRGKSVEEQVLAFTHEMLRHVNEHRHLFRAMAGKRSGETVQAALYRVVRELLRDEVRAIITVNNAQAWMSDAIVEFIAGGLFGMLMWWLNSKTRLSIEDLNATFRRLAIPSIKAIG